MKTRTSKLLIGMFLSIFLCTSVHASLPGSFLKLIVYAGQKGSKETAEALAKKAGIKAANSKIMAESLQTLAKTLGANSDAGLKKALDEMIQQSTDSTFKKRIGSLKSSLNKSFKSKFKDGDTIALKKLYNEVLYVASMATKTNKLNALLHCLGCSETDAVLDGVKYALVEFAEDSVTSKAAKAISQLNKTELDSFITKTIKEVYGEQASLGKAAQDQKQSIALFLSLKKMSVGDPKKGIAPVEIGNYKQYITAYEKFAAREGDQMTTFINEKNNNAIYAFLMRQKGKAKDSDFVARYSQLLEEAVTNKITKGLDDAEAFDEALKAYAKDENGNIVDKELLSEIESILQRCNPFR